MSYIEPRWVEDQMIVLIPFPTATKPRRGLRCRVVAAAGYHARVVNDSWNIDRWFHINDLRVLEGDPHAT